MPSWMIFLRGMWLGAAVAPFLGALGFGFLLSFKPLEFSRGGEALWGLLGELNARLLVPLSLETLELLSRIFPEGGL